MNRLLVLAALFCTPLAHADGVLDLNLIDPVQFFQNPGSVFPQNVANEAIKLFAIYASHRPYSGATSIVSSNLMDINLEATLVKIGSGLVDSLSANGYTPTTTTPPAIPMARSISEGGSATASISAFPDWPIEDNPSLAGT